MPTLFDTPPPPPDKRPFLRLARIGAGQKLQFFMLSERLYGVSTHYFDKRTSICLGPAEGCDLCAKGFSPRWGGFVAVSPINHFRAELLCITPGAYHNCPELAVSPRNFRGWVIACERLGKTSNSPLRVEVHFDPKAHKILHRLPSPSVPDALCRLWSLNNLGEDKVSPSEEHAAPVWEQAAKREMDAQDEPETYLATEEWRRLRGVE